jgi:indole-3-glycerol phosphate synthase
MEQRRADILAASTRVPKATLLVAARDRKHHSLVNALERRTGTSIIAEVKRASPSAGVIRTNYDPEHIAATYQRAGATAISVLTEPHHFGGSPDHLRAVRRVVSLPVLRKDFVCDSYQVCEAAAWGADVVLLIAAVLKPPVLKSLYEEAEELCLDVLVEIHDESELDAALACKHAIIGVNSRNLATLKTDLAVARRLAALLPPDRVFIAESGIKSRSDIEELEKLGYDGFLVGETLMKDENPAGKLAELLAGSAHP